MDNHLLLNSWRIFIGHEAVLTNKEVTQLTGEGVITAHGKSLDRPAHVNNLASNICRIFHLKFAVSYIVYLLRIKEE